MFSTTKSATWALVAALATAIVVALPTASTALTPAPPAPFIDVPASSPYNRDISRFASMGLTNGWDTPEGQVFRPKAVVNRGQMAAFLYRWMSSPDVTLPDSPPFDDLSESDTFYKEIVWMQQAGFTNGWNMPDDTMEFRPYAPVKREQVAAFLHRSVGGGVYPDWATEPYQDINKNSKFYNDIVFMHRNGITNGQLTQSGDLIFNPRGNVTREQMAAFFSRFAGEEA